MSGIGSLAERLAQDALDTAGCDPAAAQPTDLSTVARSLAVQTRLLEGPCLEGQVRWTETGPVIELAEGYALGRTKFTFAHELAHVIVSAAARSHRGLRFMESRRGRDLERLCDHVAGALLLPEPWLIDYVGREPSLPDVFAASAAADVSPSAVAVRLRQLGYSNVLFLLRRATEDWFVSSSVGVPARVRRRIDLGPSVRGVLDDADFPSVGKYLLSLSTDDETIVVPCGMSRTTGEGAFLFVQGFSFLPRSISRSWYGKYESQRRGNTANSGHRLNVDVWAANGEEGYGFPGYTG